MIFKLHNKKNGFYAALTGVIFFVMFLVLCPINNIMHAADKMQDEKKVSENQSKNPENKNTESKTGETPGELYNYEKPSVEEESYAWLIFKTIFVLGLLVGGFYYFYRFVTKKTGIHSVGRDVIKILSIVPVGQNKFLQVVDLAGRIMVIGVSDSSINLLTEIEDKDEIDRIRLLSSKSTPVQPGGFQEYISKYITKLFGSKIPGSGRSAHDDFENKFQDSTFERLGYLRKQRDRLKNMNGNDDEV